MHKPVIRWRHLSHVHIYLLILCAFGLAVPRFQAQPPVASSGPPEELHLYLTVGRLSKEGSEPPAGAGSIIDRCYVLNEKGEWEPAATHNAGHAYGFLRKMLEQDKSISIGLVPNERGNTRTEEWLGKSKLYWGVRKRARTAMRHGVVKGVLWQQGEGDNAAPDAYLEKLQTLVSNLRADLNDTNLPFVIDPSQGSSSINSQIAQLPETTHATAAVSSDDTAGGESLPGESHAGRMIAIQASLVASSPKPPADILFIDPHVHAMSVTPLGLRAVAKWMEERNVERCIVSPLNHKGSRPQTEEERETMLANFRPYRGRIDRMTIIDPGEVETVGEAVALLKREIADGAIAFGEHYGNDLMFDDPKNLMLYEACEQVGLPVMFHIDQNKNMVEPGMARVDRVLKMFPNCKIVAHAYWWRQLQHADRQLQEHPNLYADMSGSVVVNIMNRDRKFAREFLIRNQDKILWATDEGWWSFGSKDRQMNQHYTFFEELDLPEEVRRKIYRENAIKVYGLK
jgi:uncharacterized protein